MNPFPLDGPHTPEQVIAAARTAGDAVHYLCLATRTDVLGNPADLAATTGALHDAAIKLHQLFNQMADQAERWAATSGLYDARGGVPRVIAYDTAEHLRAAATASLKLIDPLAAAHEASARLGVQTPKENP